MESYLIFGMGPAGLFLSRQLRRHEKAVVIAIGKRDDIGRFSNTLDKYYATEKIEVIKQAVEEVCADYSIVTPFICSDQYLSLFLEQWPEVFSKLTFRYPSFDLLKTFLDKENLMEICRSFGMNVPMSKTLDAVCFDGLPLAVKPLVKRGISKMGKITVIRDKESLDLYKERVLGTKESLMDFLVQPYIPGDNRYEYGYGGFFENGVTLIDICFYQLRQYPQGVSCFTLEVDDSDKRERIIASVTPFIRETNYNGFIQFDIKEDEQTGVLYILDINPRPWGSISMLSAHLTENGSLWEGNKKESLCQWRFPLKEIMGLKNKMNVPYSVIKKMKKGHQIIKITDLFDKRDIKPFLMQPVISIMKLFK